MSECLLIDDLEIEVRRSDKRQNVDLVVDRNGQIVISVPAQLSDEEISKVCNQKKIWLYQTLEKKNESIHLAEPKKYVTGEGFFYLGRKYRLKLIYNEPNKSEPLKFRDGRFLLNNGKAKQGHELFVKWYSKRGQQWLEKKVLQLSTRVAKKPNSIQVRDLGYRWGSCTKQNQLLFHWRTILLPPERIEYLILHELVHLIEHSHNQRFYDRLAWACPEYKQHENWLRLHGDKYIL